MCLGKGRGSIGWDLRCGGNLTIQIRWLQEMHSSGRAYSKGGLQQSDKVEANHGTSPILGILNLGPSEPGRGKVNTNIEEILPTFTISNSLRLRIISAMRLFRIPRLETPMPTVYLCWAIPRKVCAGSISRSIRCS